MLNIEAILSLVNSKLEIQTEDSRKELVTLINSQSREVVTVLISKIKGAENFAEVREEVSYEFELK